MRELEPLKSCPFCGGEAHWPEPEVNIPYVGCKECTACVSNETIWNRRTPNPINAALRDALAACINELEHAYEGDEEFAEQHGVGDVIRTARATLASTQPQPPVEGKSG